MKRLNAYIAAHTHLSRRKADTEITKGVVKINKKICTNLSTYVKEGDVVSIANNVIKGRDSDSEVTYMFNKPKGVVCSNKRTYPSEKLVKDFFPNKHYKFITCGRLDKNTTGLLLVTNTGKVAHTVMHPSNNITKEYIVETLEEISSYQLDAISKGCLINNKLIVPLHVEKLKPFKTAITISEGKNKEIRRIYDKAKLTIISLKRIRIGGIRLGKLEEGHFKALTRQALDALEK